MSQTEPPLPALLTRTVGWIAWALAVVGGAVLLALTVITDASIVGRLLIPLGLRPIQGDFEMVEAGTAFAVFCFMPWCQFNRGHASVDIFTVALPKPVTRTISVIVDLVFAVVLTVIVWRMSVGMEDKIRNGQLTFILQMPVWWTYAAAMVGGVAWVGVSYYCLVESLASLLTGRVRQPLPEPASETGATETGP